MVSQQGYGQTDMAGEHFVNIFTPMKVESARSLCKKHERKFEKSALTELSNFQA